MDQINLEEMIRSAIDMESKIRDIYAKARESCADEAGKRVFDTLRDDEQYHLDYLSRMLKTYQETGRVKAARIDSVVPLGRDIQDQMSRLKKTLAQEDRGMIRQLLSKALEMEVQTSAFYRKAVSRTEKEAQQVFQRFLEIEDAHIQAVQHELDYVMKTGYWFDFKEFDME